MNNRRVDWDQPLFLATDANGGGVQAHGELRLYDPRNGDGEEVTIWIAGREMPCEVPELCEQIIGEWRQYLRESRNG